MNVLVVKTSSMGDVIHTLPALTDAMLKVKGIQFDWVVEESFADIPAWHPAVDRVIAVNIRRWRKQLLKTLLSGEWRRFKRQLRERHYDLVIDAQGLLKSAFVSKRALGERHGLDKASAREPWASRAYEFKHFVPKNQHAVQRVRQLFSMALRYSLPDTIADYGIPRERFENVGQSTPYALFLHATTWPSKHWPVSYWQTLAGFVAREGIDVLLPWGNESERQQAEQIAEVNERVKVLPQLGLTDLAASMSAASFVVGTDTGLAHLAAALSVPSVTIYGSTRADLTGTLGSVQTNLCADFECAPCMKRECDYQAPSVVKPACYQTVTPEQVWQAVRLNMK